MKKWKEEKLEQDRIIFSIDVKKMCTSLRREEIRKELKWLIGEDEVISGWRKEEILENVRNIWDNTFCLIDDKIVKI